MSSKHTKRLLKKVKDDYNAISKEFSQTRRYSWPEFKFFKPYLTPNAKILDLGCGNGRLLHFLEEEKISYIGLDNSEGLISQAQKLHPNHKFIIGDQLEIPLEEKSVDQIWSIAAFHHIPTKKLQKKSLKDMHRVLQDDGILVMTVWNLWQKKYRTHILKGIFNFIKTLGAVGIKEYFIPWSKSGINRYYHAFTVKELTSLLRESNFEILELFYAKKGEKVRFWDAFNICVVCKKK